jgi:hypothetical protein
MWLGRHFNRDTVAATDRAFHEWPDVAIVGTS